MLRVRHIKGQERSDFRKWKMEREDGIAPIFSQKHREKGTRAKLCLLCEANMLFLLIKMEKTNAYGSF